MLAVIQIIQFWEILGVLRVFFKAYILSTFLIPIVSLLSDVIDHLLGKTVNFEVVTAHVSYPRTKKYGVEARYKIRVRSPELSEIRQELTGLRTGPNNGHFVILVGVRNPELNAYEEFEKKLSPDEKHGELDDKEDDMDEN